MRLFLRDFVAYAGRKGIAAAVFVVFGAVLEGLSLVLIIPLLGIVIGSNLTSGWLETSAKAALLRIGLERPFGQLALLLGIFGLLMIVRAIVISARDLGAAELQAGFVEARRSAIVERLAAAPWDQVVRLRHARVTHLMSGDIQRVGAVAGQSLQCAVAAAILLAQAVLVFLLAPLLAALAFVLLALAIFIFVPAVRQAHFLGGRAADANLSLLNLTARFLGGLKLAMSQNLQAGFVGEFRQTLHDLTRLQVDAVRQQTRRRLALSTLSALFAAALVLVGFGIFEVSPPRLIALLLIMTRMVAPVGQIQRSMQQIALALPVYDKVKALERELAAIPGEPQRLEAPAQPAPLPDGPIVFHDVSFRHPADGAEPARGVAHLDLTIAPGEIVGVTGPSGAGKTTFADLLVGLFPPQDGRVTVGGVTLQGPALAAWRDRVSYISQDPFLFHDTIRRNLAWANPRAGEADIWQALRLAAADDLVRRMARGLDTPVGERGTLISGGERQRIALARAVLRKPRLMVLDEATGAIDVAGEREVMARLRMLAPRPVIVIIAHRAESVALCDRVLRFADGRCVADDVAGPIAVRGVCHDNG
ncbi:MAG: ABC transporter ATP-binding protein/permease [Pseudolabrys sp.]|nr:ABC transporter ATP-binding protein/permease [Pseudolabrys sp.]